jgi:hypothetical protein
VTLYSKCTRALTLENFWKKVGGVAPWVPSRQQTCSQSVSASGRGLWSGQREGRGWWAKGEEREKGGGEGGESFHGIQNYDEA